MICSIDGCGKPACNIRGWCMAHYTRWIRHGNPLGGGTPNGEPLRYIRDVALAYDGDECLLWPFGKGGKGYGRINNGKGVHRVVCTAAHGEPPSPEHEAAHSCGNPLCVAKAHLRWATVAENSADRLIHGTDNRGQRHAMSKLTESDVRQIRALRGKLRQKDIAAQFGVARPTVAEIHLRRTWSWLEDAA
jgi:hypothetical protein